MPEQQKPKTVDERIEAISQQLELLGHLHLRTEKELAALIRSTRSLVRTGQMIIAGHELRLRDLEDQDGNGTKEPE